MKYIDDIMSGELYHISTINHDGDVFYPRVPMHRMRDKDGITPRVCFAESIEGAMTAIGLTPSSAYEQFFFVHVPKCMNDLLKEGAFINPGDAVPDAYETHEVWCTEPVELMCIGFMMAWVDDRGTIVLELVYEYPDPKFSLEDLIRMYDEACEEKYEESRSQFIGIL